MDQTMTVISTVSFVESGQTLSGAEVADGGFLYVYRGGTAVATTIDSHGEMIVQSGLANGVVVSNGGILQTTSAKIRNVTVSSGGIFEDQAGTVASKVTDESG